MPEVSMFERTTPGGMLSSPSTAACSEICSRSMTLNCRRLGWPVERLARAK
jgi:hypothetical protein